MAGIERFIRPELATFGGYVANKSPEVLQGIARKIIKLDANENPYGCSPRTLKALCQYKDWNIYPDAEQTKLRELLQKYTGVDAERIVAGNGSDEILDEILRLFLEPGDEVINCVPTFDMYRLRTIVNRGKLVDIPRDENFVVRVAAVKSAITPKTKLIIIANPNAPTGTPTPREYLVELAETGVPFLVDEAYYEFYGETVIDLVNRYENLMVMRSFSKWAGLAGLRIGYGIFPPKIAGYLMRIKPPYNVNVAAMVAAIETLKDIDYLMKNVKKIVAERERLFGELKQFKWLNPYPSKANFILCQVLKGEASQIQQRLQRQGILIRCIDQPPLLPNCLRIAVGKPEENDMLVRRLRELEASH